MGKRATRTNDYDQRFKERYGSEVPQGDGNCFEVAIEVARALQRKGDETVRVCHGEPLGTGGDALGVRFPHAWVEVTRTNSFFDRASNKVLRIDMVWVVDRANGSHTEIPAEFYYGLGSMSKDAVVRYTMDEAYEMMATHLHYGPWH